MILGAFWGLTPQQIREKREKAFRLAYLRRELESVVFPTGITEREARRPRTIVRVTGGYPRTVKRDGA